MKQRMLFSIKPKKSPDNEVKEGSRLNTPKPKVKPNTNQSRNYEPIHCRIKQRRLQMLVHSCIYYEFNTSIITDKQFDTWAKELVKLQKDYPEENRQVPWYEEFKDWDGTTGYHLPLRDPWVVDISTKLLKYKEEI